MKKIFVLFIILALALLAACGDKPGATSSETETASSAFSETESGGSSAPDKPEETSDPEGGTSDPAEDSPAPEPLYGEIEALHDLYERAFAIGEKYGVRMYIADLVPVDIINSGNERLEDPETVASALDKIDSILSCYPEGFFDNFEFGAYTGIEFYIVGFSSVGMGYFSVNERNSLFVTLDCEEETLIETLSYTLPHELTHACDYRLDYLYYNASGHLYDPDVWNTYNPEGFAYAYDDEQLELTMYDKYYEYFAYSYGCKNALEDRATLFGQLFESRLAGSVYSTTPQCLAKLEYYCACLRDGLDSSGWPEKTFWELALDEAENGPGN